MNASNPTSLYRYYDRDGVLLYVGITGRGALRNGEHFSKPWWRHVRRQEVEHFPSRAAALAAESAAIREHQPPFNVQHNSAHADARRAYEAHAAVTESSEPIPIVACIPKRVTADVLSARGDQVLLRASGHPALQYVTSDGRVDTSGRGNTFDRAWVEGGALMLRIRGNRGWMGVEQAEITLRREPSKITVKRIDIGGRSKSA